MIKVSPTTAYSAWSWHSPAQVYEPLNPKSSAAAPVSQPRPADRHTPAGALDLLYQKMGGAPRSLGRGSYVDDRA